MFLLPEEIVELTGRKTRSKQREALQQMGIEHRVRPDGTLAVLKSHVESEMGGGSVHQPTAAHEPNWGAI